MLEMSKPFRYNNDDVVRISLVHYNTKETEKLIKVLEQF